MAEEDGKMSAADFVAWMDARSLNVSTAARELGSSRPSVMKYREEGAPRLVALACAAIAAGLPPWSRAALGHQAGLTSSSVTVTGVPK